MGLYMGNWGRKLGTGRFLTIHPAPYPDATSSDLSSTVIPPSLERASLPAAGRLAPVLPVAGTLVLHCETVKGRKRRQAAVLQIRTCKPFPACTFGGDKDSTLFLDLRNFLPGRGLFCL